MFSFFGSRTPAQRFADEAMEHICALARQIGQHALRKVGRNPSILAPLVVVGAAVAIGFWLAQPSQPVAVPNVKRNLS